MEQSDPAADRSGDVGEAARELRKHILRAARAVLLEDGYRAFDPQTIRDRPQFKALFAATDPVTFLNAYGLWMRLTYDRIGPIMSAVLVTETPDADSAAFLATVERERRIGTGVAVNRMQEMGWLRRGMTLEETIDVVWSLAGPEIYHRLINERGWTVTAYEKWLSRMFLAAVLHR